MEEYQFLIDFIKQLFTKEQQTALGIMTITVIASVEYYKNLSIRFINERSKKIKRLLIWRAALISGVCTGIGGYFIGQPPQPLWFWCVSGFIVGFVAIYAYKLLIEFMWPKVRHPKETLRKMLNK